jgi:hypothetical protein
VGGGTTNISGLVGEQHHWAFRAIPVSFLAIDGGGLCVRGATPAALTWKTSAVVASTLEASSVESRSFTRWVMTVAKSIICWRNPSLLTPPEIAACVFFSLNCLLTRKPRPPDAHNSTVMRPGFSRRFPPPHRRDGGAAQLSGFSITRR